MEVLEMVKRHYDRDVCMRCKKPLKESEGTADSRYLCSACRGRLTARKVTAKVRKQGWKVTDTGHYCGRCKD